MHIRGSKYFPELEGLKMLEAIGKKFEEDAEYFNMFKYYIFNFEKIVMNKRTRKKKNN